MHRIFELLRRESGIDFSGYKESTVSRRIERRLLLSESFDLEHYVKKIESDPGERSSLYRDLLIGVTRFFRDPEAFERLKGLLSQRIEHLKTEEEFRVWVPGCATGEEAYSIALLLQEAFREKGRRGALRIFATDVHRPSLEIARAGIYPPEGVRDIPEELRARYFQRQGQDYRISPDLRSCIVFIHHNVLCDAPFARLDLISCRNLLIYFKPPGQRKVLSLFHFALKAGGILFLGPSETPGALREELDVVDTRWKLFRKRRDILLPPETCQEFTVRPGADRSRPSRGELRVSRAQERLLERYAPASLLVDQNFRLLHSFNGGGTFLAPRDGKPSLHILDTLPDTLQVVVADALKRAVKERQTITYPGIEIKKEEENQRVQVVVEPLEDKESQEPLFLISLVPEHKGTPRDSGRLSPDLGALARERILALEHELRQSRESLQATVEEMEASHEELLASNEELQSTNEELHSVNEELYTVNAEHQAKIAELTELTEDVRHILESTEAHTLFLDRELRLRKFTPKMAQAFHLLPQDIGRRLDSFAHDLNDASLFGDLERVLHTGRPIEREVTDRRERSFSLRILPYRSGQAIIGVVLTLIDISARKRAERELQASEERYRALLRAFKEGHAPEWRDQALEKLSYELRTPLSAILEASELLLHANADEQEKKQACQVINSQARHMTKLLNDLLGLPEGAREEPTARREQIERTVIREDTEE